MSEQKMNPEVKARWVAALRSGKYKQGQERLRTNEGFCCLGVLCDLYAEEFEIQWEQCGGEGMRLFIEEGGPWYPPHPVRKWASFHEDQQPVSIEGGGKRSVANHNDDGRSFAEIADAIEAQL